MIKIKLDAKLVTSVDDALAPHAGPLYATIGKRIVVIAELRAAERVEVADGEEKHPSVKLRCTQMEVAGEEQEDPVRKAMAALYTLRTAYGKITEDFDIELSDETLRRCAGDVVKIEAARLQSLVQHWGHYVTTLLYKEDLTGTELRRELETVRDGLRAAVGLVPA